MKLSAREKRIAARLLEAQRKQDQWRQEIEGCENIEIREPISDGAVLLHIALDLLGVPPEEHDPEGGPIFCRDAYEERFEELVLKHGNVSGFIEEILNECESA